MTLQQLQKLSPLVILILSGLGILGSLYFQVYGDPVSNLQLGNIFMPNNGFTPCLLCWWQRIFLYPVFVIALIGIIFRDKNFARYTLALSAIGGIIALYHYMLQKLPINNPFECSAAVPCSATEVNYLGFITIPFLALVSYIGIVIASIVILKKK